MREDIEEAEAKVKKPKTVLCIPGNWENGRDILRSVAEANLNEYIFAGLVLLNMKTNKSFQIEIYGHDEDMATSFQVAGMVNQVSEDFIEAIDEHTCVIYIIGDTGDLESAKEIAKAGNAFLKGGGIGLKVESTGKAFTKEHWSELVEEDEIGNLHEMFVLDSIVNEQGETYTCGMHNLGYKDTIVGGLDFQDAVNLVSIFGYYQVAETADIRMNQTFSIAVDEPIFEIAEELNQPNKGDELFENQYGMWRLAKVG